VSFALATTFAGFATATDIADHGNESAQERVSYSRQGNGQEQGQRHRVFQLIEKQDYDHGGRRPAGHLERENYD